MQLKFDFQRLLDLLLQAGSSPTAMKKCFEHLESSQAEFSVIDNDDDTGLCAKATRTFELIRTCFVSGEEGMKYGGAQEYLLTTLGNEDYKHLYNFDHACITPPVLATYPVEDGNGHKKDKDKNNKVIGIASYYCLRFDFPSLIE